MAFRRPPPLLKCAESLSKNFATHRHRDLVPNYLLSRFKVVIGIPSINPRYDAVNIAVYSDRNFQNS